MTPFELGRSLVVKAVRFELNMWRDLFHWVSRRPVAPAGSEPFSYAGAVSAVMWGIIAVSFIEIPVLHMLLPDSWETVKLLSIVLGVYGVLWMVGLLAGMKIHPHLLGHDGLRVRYANSIDFTVPWEAVAAVGGRIRSLPKNRTIQMTDATILNIGQSSATNVDISFHTPIRVRLPKGPSEPVTELRIWADHPDALRRKAHEFLQECRARRV
jgi:hypothetical protein